MENFQWTDELVKEFYEKVYCTPSMNPEQDVEKFKQSKVKKEEPKQEWEILSLQMHNNTIIHKSSYTYPECFQTLINAKEFPIHSVKRLSDNEVFSIGDKTNRGTILEIFIDDRLRFKVTEEKGYALTLIELIEKEKPEEPLPIKVIDFKSKFKNQAEQYVSYCFTSHEIPAEKYLPIKKAIESVLNPIKGQWDSIDEIIKHLPKTYTSDELLEAQRAAFSNGRMMEVTQYNGIDILRTLTYKTFEDYLQSIENQSLNK